MFLEVNVNPAISPDAGLRRPPPARPALDYDALVGRLVDEAVQRARDARRGLKHSCSESAKSKTTRHPANAAVISEAQTIMRRQFAGYRCADIDKLPDQLRDPFRIGSLRACSWRRMPATTLHGLALLLFFSDIRVCYLELISAAPGAIGRGIGDALYTRVREEAIALGADALFFECLPDDPSAEPGPRDPRQQNAARLKFYERFGARPIIGTAYETPLRENTSDPPYLVADMLGAQKHRPRCS